MEAPPTYGGPGAVLLSRADMTLHDVQVCDDHYRMTIILNILHYIIIFQYDCTCSSQTNVVAWVIVTLIDIYRSMGHCDLY